MIESLAEISDELAGRLAALAAATGLDELDGEQRRWVNEVTQRKPWEASVLDTYEPDPADKTMYAMTWPRSRAIRAAIFAAARTRDPYDE